ncbi:MAG: RnfABCDGE type electron transport complex subunit D [Candidatus Ornithospirochaeta sp.]
MVTVRTSPHDHDTISTDKAMLLVAAALLPSALWGCVMFGFRAVLVLLVSVGSALLTEWLLGKINNENTLSDYSALVTGLLVGMNMPSGVPLFIPLIASVFAIAVVKWTFGGLGCNWANPAIAGRIFVFFSFSSLMSKFPLPWVLRNGAELTTGATPLTVMKMEMTSGLASETVLASSGTPVSGVASAVSSALGINPYTVDAFFGFTGGCIGEVSALLLLLGGLFLIWKKVISWRIPVSFILSYAVLTWVFGGLRGGNGLMSGEVILPVLSGGLMLGAFFMATDWVTTPTTAKGEVIFAIGCGFFTFIIRCFGSLPEGVSLAILLMNMVSPTIDKFCRPKKFGYVKAKKEKGAGK